ncbi:putative nucleotidyltransferase with HDIG domain [Peribacillus deserti]|uniref:Nucleotidyltransferase with HDIG domain n=1 Tax=Peribacillus deserti TaxID=673318 RepID=A0ABS2QDV4_9BACI|nr:HD-GYP domain-containing protein [Peribacillus deserti]MBM7691165.1 putative nucleotidyltransferase with HDIG domain [Peribacillus deserti]
MEGLQINKNGESIENILLGSTELRLLGSKKNLEIMHQTVFKDNMFYLYPSDDPEVTEFIYILDGIMAGDINNKAVEIRAGDYCLVNGLKEIVHFTAITDVSYLWIITEPAYSHITDHIKNLREFVTRVEQKDKYTYLHSERVAKYSIKIAKKLKLQKEQVENLFLAAGFHDVGKINVPEEILNKPGRLTDEEFDIIKKHPVDSAKMIKHIYSGKILEIIEQHHERLNGSGYPYGLKENDILHEAKIIAVADTFNAMTEDRAYRKAYSAQYALDEIKSMIGTHYDEEVVSAFEAVLLEEGRISK